MKYYNIMCKVCVLLLGIVNAHEDKTYNIHYTAVGPNSNICLCVPSYIIKRTTDSDLTNWDGECSNNQVCFWNEEAILIKYWYSPIN